MTPANEMYSSKSRVILCWLFAFGYLLAFNMVIDLATAHELKEFILIPSQFYTETSRVPGLKKIIINHLPDEGESSVFARHCLGEQFTEFGRCKSYILSIFSNTHQGIAPPRFTSNNWLIVDSRQLCKFDGRQLIPFSQKQVRTNLPDDPWRFPKILEDKLNQGFKRDGLIGRSTKRMQVVLNNERGEKGHGRYNGGIGGFHRSIGGLLSDTKRGCSGTPQTRPYRSSVHT